MWFRFFSASSITCSGRAELPLAAGRRFGRSDHRGRGRRRRVGACVAPDTADTVYQSAVELNRSRDM